MNPHSPSDPAPEASPGADQPVYERFDSRGDFDRAVDRLLEQPGRELRIFDPDLASLRLNAPARVAMLERFLAGSRARRVFIALHDPEPMSRYAPRMMSLLARYAHAMQVNRTHEEIRNLQDAFLVMDAAHYVRRPAASFYRGALGLGDEPEALAMRARFLEIWAASYPAVSGSVSGL